MRFKSLKFFLFLIVLKFNTTSAFYYNDTPLIEAIKTDAYFKSYYNPLFNQTINYLQFLSKNNEINSKCRHSLSRWIEGLELSELWALKFLEATGKTINGKLTGRNMNFGSFDHCIEFVRDPDQRIDFDGKYCLVSIHSKETEIIKNLENYKAYQRQITEVSARSIEFNIGNTHGICMPSWCSVDEITSVTNKLLKSKQIGISVMPPKRCTSISEPEPISFSQIICFIILSAFILLAILSCFIKNDFLSNFSLTNSYNVIYQSDPNMDSSKSFLHTVKFGLVLVSVTSHTTLVLGVFFSQPYATVKEVEFSTLMKLFLSRIYLFGDTMFFMGGFFTMYAWYDVVKNGRMRYNFFNFFFLRYFKVFIASVSIILITIVLPHLGTGPLFSDITNHISSNCQTSWWRVFLLISNEQRMIDQCIIPNWYLSADFQIYLLNYFVIYYLIKRPKFGLFLTATQMIVVSLFTCGYVHYFNIKSILNQFDLYYYDLSLFEDIYFHSFYHYNAYSLGIICAWLIKNEIKPKIFDYKVVRYVVGIASFSSFFLLLIYIDYIERTSKTMNKYVVFFWPVIDKILNVAAPFWLFYSVLSGYSETMKRMMSTNFALPWSRLNFSLITVQFTYLIYLLASTRNPFTFNPAASLKEMAAALIFIFLLGNFIFLFFENPCLNILKSYMGIKRRSELNNDTSVEINNNNNNNNNVKREGKEKTC